MHGSEVLLRSKVDPSICVDPDVKVKLTIEARGITSAEVTISVDVICVSRLGVYVLLFLQVFSQQLQG